MTNLDDARRAYEAAKMLERYFQNFADAKFSAASMLTLATATAAYEAALLADAQAKLDAMGVVIGETLCCDIMPSKKPYVIDRLEAMPDRGMVRCHHNGGFADYDVTRPYVAPEAKEMVLYGPTLNERWIPHEMATLTHRLTLSGITPADLDGMTGSITGTFTVEKL